MFDIVAWLSFLARDEAAEITLYERDARAFHRNIRASAHRNADVCLRKAGASLTPSPAMATLCPAA